jgi:hypothetical protein
MSKLGGAFKKSKAPGVYSVKVEDGRVLAEF